MENSFVRELMCEIPIDAESFYAVALKRVLDIDDYLAFQLDVFVDHGEEARLIGGTTFIKFDDGFPVFVEGRANAYANFTACVRELLAYVHLGRTPKHPLLTPMLELDKIEAARVELADLYNIVIE